MSSTKLFISHASEDKADFVEPLVEALRAAGFEVWYDRYELTLGDSLLQKISQGLRECDFGVVVLSPDFFRKKWTQAELDGLFAIESTERKVILPIWKNVTVEDVTAFSPILAGRLGAPTSGGIGAVVAEIQRAVQAAERVATFSNGESAIAKFMALENEILGAKRADELSRSMEGVRLVADAAKAMILWLKQKVDGLGQSSKHLKLSCTSSSNHELRIAGGYALRYDLVFSVGYTNSITGVVVKAHTYQGFPHRDLESSTSESIWEGEFQPYFDHSGELLWRSDLTSQAFTSEGLQTHLLDVIVDGLRHLHMAEVAKRAL